MQFAIIPALGFFLQNSKPGPDQRFYQKFKNHGTGTSGSFKILEPGLEVLLRIENHPTMVH
jgi:hypothetical protein